MNTQVITPQVNRAASLAGVIASLPKNSVNLYDAANQWRTRPADQRFTTLEDLAASVNSRRLRSRAADIQLADVKFRATEGDNIQIETPWDVLSPSHWSFGQVCRNIGAPADYIRKLPAELAVRNLTHSAANAAREDVKLLSVESGDSLNESTLQAVTSTTYGRIWDADVVEAVQRIRERSGGKFFNPKDWSGTPSGLYASDHDVFCFLIDGGSLVDGGGERDQLHRGFFVSNSETGARSFRLVTFLFRAACGNHIVWGAEDISEFILRHTQGAPGRFDREAFPKLLEYVNASSKPVEDSVRKAKAYRLPYTDDKGSAEGLVEFGRKYGFNRSEIRGAHAAATKEEGQCANLWDLVNGLTAHARGYAFVDARVELEQRAGGLLKIIG